MLRQENYFQHIVTASSPRDGFKLALKKANDTAKNLWNSKTPKESYMMTTYRTIENSEELRSLIDTSLDCINPHRNSPLGCIRINDNPKTYIFYGYL
jgi:hypothetical protein